MVTVTQPGASHTMRFLPIFAAAALAACSSMPMLAQEPAPTPDTESTARPYMVAAANPHAVEAGLAALRAGGNAVDAAIAVEAVLSLVEPQSSGLGGGAFMLYLDAATGEITVYDGRETAPASATPEHFLDETGEPLSFVEAWTSGRAVGVPGVVAMLAMAHEDHGARPWADNFDPAIALAETGFAVSPRLHSLIVQASNPALPFSSRPDTGGYFFTEAGEPLPVGHVRDNPAYAGTLRAVAADWRNFYTGEIAEGIVEAVNSDARPGGMTLEDLAGYAPVRRDAICRLYRAWRVCGAPPPASGGVTVNELLALLEPYDMAATGPGTVEGWRRFIEASRLAYADRDAYIGDPAFADIPVAGLLDSGYLSERATLIDRDTAIPAVTAGTPPGVSVPGVDATAEPGGTTHFVIVDAGGNVVSMTATVESLFGNQRMVGGFLLNNQLTDFSFTATGPDGRPAPNAVAGGKRPRSSMSPTIVLDQDGEFHLATGSPGGSSIIAYVAKSLVAMLDWDLTPQEAISLPNVVARGDVVRIEDSFPPDMVDALEALGFTLDANRSENSGLHAVRVLPDGTLTGGADPRREGVVGE
mgnify:CR=1 FL=1